MRRIVITIAALTGILTVIFALLYRFISVGLYLTLAISFGTTAYHFWMRLAVGLLFNIFMHNKDDLSNPWYQLKPFEKKLYDILRVKKWKDHLPTFDSSRFDPSLHSWEEIAMAMCQAELVHETIIPLSFLPIIATAWFGEPAVFIITSVIAALFDLAFVIVQRYNRPRVIRLINRKRG